MSARSPRRSFATPFVITLAAAPACYVQPTPQQPTTTMPQQGTVTPTPTQAATPDNSRVVMNPPRPQATTPNARWRIFKDPNGAGCMSQPQVTCPPNTACNPPRPQPYTCPTDLNLETFGPATILSSADGMSCSVEFAKIECKAGATCNPPPPVSVSCPRP